MTLASATLLVSAGLGFQANLQAGAEAIGARGRWSGVLRMETQLDLAVDLFGECVF
jgi:hypothetical protein